MFKFSYIDVMGAVGACLILFGFYRISIGRWKNKSFWYEMDNFAGATLLVFYQVHNRAHISAVLNVIWAVVAFRGLSPFAERYQKRVFRKRRRKN